VKYFPPVCSFAAQVWVVNSEQPSGYSVFLLLPLPGSKSHSIGQALKRKTVTPNTDFLLTQKNSNVDFFNCDTNVLIKRRNANQGVSGKKPKTTITEVKKVTMRVLLKC